MWGFGVKLPGLIFLTFLLSACDKPEDRAEEYYQLGLAALETGDTDEGFTKFRDAVRLHPSHTGALQEYATLLAERGANQEAISQLIQVVRLDAKNATAQRDVAELALRLGDLETATTHAEEAYSLDAGDPVTRALKATTDYFNETDPEAAVETANGVLAEMPDNFRAHSLLIQDHMAASGFAEALAQADTALEQLPENEQLHVARLSALLALGNEAESELQLERMVELFPENRSFRDQLVRWYTGEGNLDAAEGLLRENAANDPENTDEKMAVIGFLFAQRGEQAGRDELDRLIATEEDPQLYQRALAEFNFDSGMRDEAVSYLNGLIADQKPSDGTRLLQVSLARMLQVTGDQDASAALLETVLEGDPKQVEALKMRARNAIGDDRAHMALKDMDTAREEDRYDPEIYTISALAHERMGSRSLMKEELGLAVGASDYRADEALRYAAFLMEENETGQAEGVILEAMRRQPDNPFLLNMLGRIHLARRDWARVGQVVNAMGQMSDPRATGLANALNAANLEAQGRSEDNMALLRDLAEQDGGGQAMEELIRQYQRQGDLPGARAYLESWLADDPENLQARYLLAGIEAASGELESAAGALRELIAEEPEIPQTYQMLYSVLNRMEESDEAERVLEEGIATSPANYDLLIMKAGLLEIRGDIAGAIAIYEDLYERNSNDLRVVNNLASLLTQGGADKATLERAHTIAQRLRNSNDPYQQDTLGWIIHLRGDSLSALELLRPAAEAAPGVALIQFHRGEAELGIENTREAKAAFEQALEAYEAGSHLPQIDALRSRLSEG